MIFLVEDDAPIATLVRTILESEGFEVHHDADGRTAAALVGAKPAPELVVLDIALPHVDGIQILDRIRADEEWASVPVIMLTARASEDDVVKALDRGANDYIAKPFRPDELLDRIRRLLL